MRRIVLVLSVAATVIAMMAFSAALVVAQEDSILDDISLEDTIPGEDIPGGDTTEEDIPGGDTTGDEAGPGGQTLFCAPEWSQEWYIWTDPQGKWGKWWYFYWFTWCYDDEGGWFKAYDGWDWWGPVEE